MGRSRRGMGDVQQSPLLPLSVYVLVFRLSEKGLVPFTGDTGSPNSHVSRLSNITQWYFLRRLAAEEKRYKANIAAEFLILWQELSPISTPCSPRMGLERGDPNLFSCRISVLGCPFFTGLFPGSKHRPPCGISSLASPWHLGLISASFFVRWLSGILTKPPYPGASSASNSLDLWLCFLNHFSLRQ